jgi:hypothetical protein
MQAAIKVATAAFAAIWISEEIFPCFEPFHDK